MDSWRISKNVTKIKTCQFAKDADLLFRMTRETALDAEGLARLSRNGTPMQWVLKHPDLTTFDKYLYALLATYANRNTGIVDMAIPAIAKQAGASRKGIGRIDSTAQRRGRNRENLAAQATGASGT